MLEGPATAGELLRVGIARCDHLFYVMMTMTRRNVYGLPVTRDLIIIIIRSALRPLRLQLATPIDPSPDCTRL